MKFSQSKDLFIKAQHSIPGGVNSPVRAFKSVKMDHPLFMEKGKGSKIYDVDQNEFIDYVGSWGPLILGHCHPQVMQALAEVLSSGTSFGTPTEKEIILAEMIKSAVPSMEMVRLVNSGTEATMGAIRVARGHTKREKIIKFEGCYHGSMNSLLVKAGSGATTLGVPNSAGVPVAETEMTLLAEFNNLESVIERVDEFSGEIAAIILEPITGNMGLVIPDHHFLQGLRSVCDREGILLIFDEVMTGFRVDYGGAQALFKIQPDLTTLGKVIGGGLPVGAYGGRQDIMLNVAPAGAVYQAGTLSGNPLAVTAGIATMRMLKEPNTYADLAEKSGWLVQEMKDAFHKKGIPIQFNHVGGMFGFFLSEKPVRNYHDALECDLELFAQLFKNLLQEGIYFAPSAFESLFMSTAHSEEDLEFTVNAIKNVLQTL